MEILTRGECAMKRNRLRELLNEGKPTLGIHVICPWPGMVEVIGYSDAFDYIEYVGEYSPFSLEQLDNFGRAIELFPRMSSMMKVEEQTRGFIAQRALDDNAVIAIMIEKKGAFENLEEILSVKGVDMVQFGPADYSISIGKPGQRQASEVLKAEKDTIEMALKMGVVPRVEVASFERTKPYIEMGVRHFCIGWDIRIIHSWCKEQAEGMRKLLKL
jgi:2-keto-3-deoxy-L-rhamnonate aldolase RhmA